MWVTGKTICDPTVTHGPYLNSERFRDKELIIKRYT